MAPRNDKIQSCPTMMKFSPMLLLGALLISTASSQTTFTTDHFTGVLDGSSGVLRSLKSKTDQPFDFSPADVFNHRNGNGNYHTGDLTLRYRVGDSTSWVEGSTASNRTSVPHSSRGTILSSQVDFTINGIHDYF